ncbi:MAG: hypothetical protein K5662_04175 [Lachnospiraceae bacterium]|nr:hypothetical protein [Lachnospiraceae bacterium]
MDDITKAERTVNGYLFGSEADVKLAQNELKKVKYINERVDNMDVATLLSVYKGALEKRIFRTPVGYGYLHDLQRKLLAGGCPLEDIPPIPMYQVFASLQDTEKEPVKRRNVIVRKRKSELIRKNGRLRIAVIVLSVLVVLMFVISMSGSSVTIINYREKVRDEYADWEQELKERENAVKVKERELKIETIQKESQE